MIISSGSFIAWALGGAGIRYPSYRSLPPSLPHKDYGEGDVGILYSMVGPSFPFPNHNKDTLAEIMRRARGKVSYINLPWGIGAHGRGAGFLWYSVGNPCFLPQYPLPRFFMGLYPSFGPHFFKASHYPFPMPQPSISIGWGRGEGI